MKKFATKKSFLRGGRTPATDLALGLAGLACVVSVSFLAGCGGVPTSSNTGSGGTANATASGRATFTVVWPAATTKLVPVGANSIRVDILRNGSVIATQLLARPASGSGSASLSFTNLPVTSLTARATAFPNSDGTGTAQATGSVPVTIVANGTASISITMATTIDHIDVTPSPATVVVGQTATLTETARDASNNVVLTTASLQQWATDTSAVAIVDANGVVTGVAAGKATITVTDKEAGKAGSVTVTVSAAPTPTPSPTASADPFAGVHAYLNLDLNNLYNYANPIYPVHYDAAVLAQDNAPSDNPVTDKGATLGRVLFNDPRLSVNDTIACATCHQQASGMTNTLQFSVGFDGSIGTRRAMRLGNVRFYQGKMMFWDKRAANVEDQATQPIQNSIEMGFDTAHGGLTALFTKMAALPYYPELFAWVYGDPTITEDRVEKALAQYERAMVSTSSAFDTGYAQVYNRTAPGKGIGTDFPNFTAQQNRGKTLFLAPPNQGGGGCAGCHQTPTFALDPNSGSNGLDAGETTVFKAPSLKNIGRTGPYMHDGRFATLANVVDHYISGVQVGPATDKRLQTPGGNPLRLNLTTADRDAIVAFLQTLNDDSLVSDPKFSNPFVK